MAVQGAGVVPLIFNTEHLISVVLALQDKVTRVATTLWLETLQLVVAAAALEVLVETVWSLAAVFMVARRGWANIRQSQGPA